MQADQTGDEPLSDRVKAYIKEKYNKPGDVYLGIPHRVDRPVSGVVLFAKTSKALVRLNKMFQEHDQEITKIYWAIVGNLPAEDHANLPITWCGMQKKINPMLTTNPKMVQKKPFWNTNY